MGQLRGAITDQIDGIIFIWIPCLFFLFLCVITLPINLIDMTIYNIRHKEKGVAN